MSTKMLLICRNYKRRLLRQIGTTGNLRMADMRAKAPTISLTLRGPLSGRLEGRGPGCSSGTVHPSRRSRFAASSG
jgi:hypothetical protein